MRILVDVEGCTPTRANASDAGWDLRASEQRTLAPGERALIDVGIRVAVEDGQMARILPRSGLAVKSGIDTLAGVVDAGYRGPVKVALMNHGSESFVVNVGDRIAQLVVMQIDSSEAEFVDSLEDTERSDGGFGSSGTN